MAPGLAPQPVAKGGKVSSPRNRWRVDLHPQFEDVMGDAAVSEGAAVGLLIAIDVLWQYAGDLPGRAIGGRTIRWFISAATYVLPDGLIVPPFAILYETSADSALIIAVREFAPEPNNPIVCGTAFIEELTQYLTAVAVDASFQD